MAELKQNLEQQIDEFELLQCMFSGPGEFQVEDETSYDQVIAFLKDLTPHTPGRLSFSVHILIDAQHQPLDSGSELSSRDGSAAESKAVQHTVDISFRLPHSYPDVHPEVYVSSNDLSRVLQDDLNTSLREHITAYITTGDVCLLSIVEWIRDNSGEYFPIPSTQDIGTESVENTSTHFCRKWLYMHHIFSKTKRRNILSLASELGLTGFCLPGKPGVVCVEGEEEKTKEFYSILRRWNWKSITCRKNEVVSDCDVQSQRKIEGFQELVFDTHGQRQTHMDLGQFLEYLRDHQLEYMFKILFGVEGHSSDGSSTTKDLPR